MDKLQWFKFTPSDWMMGKIMRCSEITQARFIRLCCLYWNKECVLSYEDADIEIDNDHLEMLIKKKIIKVENEDIIIEFLDEQLTNILETSEKRRKAAHQRWNTKKSKSNAIALQVDASALQNDADKIREEKKRKDYTKSEFLKDWNEIRTKQLKKPSHVNRLSYDGEQALKDICTEYNPEEIRNALIGLFKQEKLPNGNTVMQSNPNHFLKHFESYLQAYHDRNTSLYGKKETA